MGYARTKDTVYVVHWPEINVFKVGYSAQQRWRSFVLRGANVLKLMEFDTSTEAFLVEGGCHAALWEVSRSPFQTPLEAAPYLGNGGGGYVECFKVPGDLMASEILEYIRTLLGASNAQA